MLTPFQRATAALGFLAAAAPFAHQPASAQENADDPQEFPPNTIVARFQIDPTVLADATTSGELIALLREHLRIDLGMPLKEPLAIMPRGYAGDQSAGMVYHFGLGQLGLRVVSAGTWADLDYAMAVRESHGEDFPPDDDMWDEIETDEEWDEDEAWANLVEALDIGLPQSADGFQQPAQPGTLPLRVKAVHFVAADDYETDEKLGGAILRLQPDPYFQSAMEGIEVGYDLRTILIQLAPRG